MEDLGFIQETTGVSEIQVLGINNKFSTSFVSNYIVCRFGI